MSNNLIQLLWFFYGLTLGIFCIILSKKFKSFKNQIISLIIFTIISLIIILFTPNFN